MGIDYGMGLTNIDPANGIRYGVIPMNSVSQAWGDSSEPDYGEPHCPKCGNPACNGESKSVQSANGVTVWTEQPEHTEDWECSGCGDYRCDDCEYLFDGDEAFGDEASAWYLGDGEYVAAQSGDDCDIFITKSPYYTFAEFCSPCAPGAGYLLSPNPDGPKTYCFAADWFDSEFEPCPYPVYRVDNDECVYTPEATEESDNE